MTPLSIPALVVQPQTNLRAKHWDRWGDEARFQVLLAANNSPAMGTKKAAFSNRTVMLVQEAYNQLRGFARPTRENGLYDGFAGNGFITTREAIRRFQSAQGLGSVDGIAGRQTLTRMDQLLVDLGR